MKNLFLALTIVSSCSLQAMHEHFSSMSLIPIEQELVKDAIKTHGLDCVRGIINNPKNQEEHVIFEVQAGFYKNEAQTDTLTKNIFDEIEKIESKPENKGNLPTKRNHFSFRTWYYRDRRNLDVVYVTMKSNNIQELNAICDSYIE